MLRVSDLMDPRPFGFLPTQGAREALGELLARKLGGAPVHTHTRRLLGVVTCPDLDARRSDRETVVDRMTTATHTIHPGATPREAARRLLGTEAGHLVVVEDGFLVGLVSAADVQRHVSGPPTTPPVEFRHFDARHDVFWSDVFPLDLDAVDLTPPSAGVIMLSRTGGSEPEHTVLITGHLRGRLREMVEEDGVTGLDFRVAEVTDPCHARRIQEDLQRAGAPAGAYLNGAGR